MNGPVETEIKIPFRQGAAAAARLLEAHGYRITVPRTFQADQVYDFKDRTLRESGRLLRVRSEEGPDGGAILTSKDQPISNRPHKSREELETSAGSLATLELILQRLGFVRSFRYEKYRTTYRFAAGSAAKLADQASGGSEEQGLIALDETPIGDYLELEGPSYWIDGTAESLGFSPSEYVTASYAALYRAYLAARHGPPDMTFLGTVIGSGEKDS